MKLLKIIRGLGVKVDWNAYTNIKVNEVDRFKIRNRPKWEEEVLRVLNQIDLKPWENKQALFIFIDALSSSNIKTKKFQYLLDNLQAFGVGGEHTAEYLSISGIYGKGNLKTLRIKENLKEYSLLNHLLNNYRFYPDHIQPINFQENPGEIKFENKKFQSLYEQIKGGWVENNFSMIISSLSRYSGSGIKRINNYKNNLIDKISIENKFYLLVFCYFLCGVQLINVIEGESGNNKIKERLLTEMGKLEKQMLSMVEIIDFKKIEESDLKNIVSALGSFVGYDENYYENKVKLLSAKTLVRINDPQIEYFFFNNTIGQGYIKKMQMIVDEEKTRIEAMAIDNILVKSNIKSEQKI